jgi:hypothetical protein
MTDRLKNLVEQIHKIAQVPGRSKGDKISPTTPPGGTGGSAVPQRGSAVPQRGNTAPHGGAVGNTNSATAAIKTMQQAMQAFANKVTSYSSTIEKGSGPPAKPGGKPTDKEVINDDRKDFNDFITEQYLATSDVKGVEWSKDPKTTSQADKAKQQTDLIEMDYVIDGLRRIGSPKTSELNTDNFWDFRTNNALKNIYAFAYALMNVEKDFGKGAAKVFNASDLKAMNENIPMNMKDPSRTLSSEDKVTRAEALTPLIEKLGNFYDHYVKKIALNPYYRTYIEKKSPMFSVKSQDKDPGTLSPVQQKRMEQFGDTISIKNVVVPAKSGQKTINIPISFLKDDRNFSTLMTQVLGYSDEEATYPTYKKAVLDAILNNVKNYLSQAPPAHL